MTREWLFPVGIFWGVITLGMIGAGKPLTTFDLWLDKHDAPITAQANALSPVINCINRVDVQWHLAYERYTSPAQLGEPVRNWMANQHDFDDGVATTVNEAQRDVCSPKISEKLSILGYEKSLVTLADDYVQALERVTPLTLKIRFYQQPVFSQPTYELPPEFAVQFQPRADAYLLASAALRQRVETLDLEQRREQLKLIEARHGKDIHWYLLDYMIQAKDTLNVVSDGVKNRSLTPQALALTTRELQLAWDYRQQFNHAELPETRKRNEVPRYLWDHITGPAQKYLDALNTLHNDWQNKAEPQRLSEDFYAVTRGYDSLVSHYNRMARFDY
ncbi:YiiG family protein [Pseudomonas sp. B21-040]|jgi:hypothetical protein|uniref:DUF3829 domain-containing protein n=1 Tax=unclassified Pseudomonas TaxID=196821 RepID=UPI000D7B0859|nr:MULTISPECIES: DUF3829 domain-containing protein [unclassified Pseudomonas]PWK40303.1 uncharacterized protein DUF3829 [Pseudomonas sp. OV226]UVL37945.1 YiiG family protein [Pseudomonas sp. B21-040]